MGKSKVGRLRQHTINFRGEEANKSEPTWGSRWVRISYERSDGRIQVQYLLFDSRGCVHSVIDGQLSKETERWDHDVDAAQGYDCGDKRVIVVPCGSWTVRRVVG